MNSTMSRETAMQPPAHWNEWLDRLAIHDFVFVDNFISDELFSTIQQYFKSLLDKSEFSKAAIGSSTKRQVQSSIRGDFIYWVDQEVDMELHELFETLDKLVGKLKEYLLLSISDYEFHFALYPPKTRYEKHVDQFKGKNNRLISVLIYLNEHWQPGDGGELKIYQSNGDELLIQPIAKRLVMFKSDTVEHEVMTTNTPRKSLTGWLLHKPASLGYF